MIQKDITYIGTYATGTLHQMFDTCFLHVCAIASHHVDCYKHKSTFEYIEAKGIEYGFINKVKLIPIGIHRSKSKIGGLIDTVLSAWKNVYLYLKSPKNNIVVINYNNLFSLHLLNILNKIKKQPLFIACHGEMELLANEGGGAQAKLNRYLIRSFFNTRRISRDLYFIVLGDSIKNNLSNYLRSESLQHFISIDHPYYLKDGSKQKKLSNHKVTEPLELGLIGTLSPEKGLNDFISFIKEVRKQRIDCHVSIIGRLSTHSYDELLNEYGVNVSWVYLSRDEMEKRIRNLDYALFFYPPYSYKLIASGALFDPIQLGVPVLALHNDYFEYVLEKSKHPSALFKDIKEMVHFVSNPSVLPIAPDSSCIDSFSPEKVAENFSSLLSNKLGC